MGVKKPMTYNLKRRKYLCSYLTTNVQHAFSLHAKACHNFSWTAHSISDDASTRWICTYWRQTWIALNLPHSIIYKYICLFCMFLKKKVKAVISDGITWAASFHSNRVHLVVDRLASYIADSETVDQASSKNKICVSWSSYSSITVSINSNNTCMNLWLCRHCPLWHVYMLLTCIVIVSTYLSSFLELVNNGFCH